MITTEQHREIEARLERNRKPEKKVYPACYICGDPVTENVRIVSQDLLRVEHVRCQKKESGSIRLVLDFWASEGVPMPYTEFRFHPHRKWRFDFAWPARRLYLECQGGIFVQGRHVRGKALLDEWEKIGEATILDWRPLFCQPSDLLTVKQATTIKRALKL